MEGEEIYDFCGFVWYTIPLGKGFFFFYFETDGQDWREQWEMKIHASKLWRISS